MGQGLPIANVFTSYMCCASFTRFLDKYHKTSLEISILPQIRRHHQVLPTSLQRGNYNNW